MPSPEYGADLLVVDTLTCGGTTAAGMLRNTSLSEEAAPFSFQKGHHQRFDVYFILGSIILLDTYGDGAHD